MVVLEQQLLALKLRSLFFFSFLFPFLIFLEHFLLTQCTDLWLVFLAQCPTTIVPFFGDQPFWGDRVHVRGVGPAPISVEQFSLQKLVDAINFMLDPKVIGHYTPLSNCDDLAFHFNIKHFFLSFCFSGYAFS